MLPRRWLVWTALAAAPACRMEVSGQGTMRAAPGSALAVSAESGELSLDETRLPVLPDGVTCEPGHLLGRTDEGWACRAETPSLGIHDHDERYPAQTEVYTRQQIDGAIDSRAQPTEQELAEARADAASLAERLAAIEARLEEVEAQVAPRVCPTLFLPDGTEVRYQLSDHLADRSFLVCLTEVAGNAWDQMVRVGDFWIDRHELSPCDDQVLWGFQTGADTGVRACSVPGAAPKAGLTWFQAAAACANAGKRLCSTTEWLAAASATADTGRSDGADGRCLTEGPAARTTGRARVGEAADDCVSRFGAEDMVGNLGEWVADWGQAGLRWQASDGQLAPACGGVASGPWPSGYGTDATWNVNGQTSTDACGWQKGLPAAVVRGGSRADGDGAGVHAASLRLAPSAISPDVGARCCVGGG